MGLDFLIFLPLPIMISSPQRDRLERNDYEHQTTLLENNLLLSLSPSLFLRVSFIIFFPIHLRYGYGRFMITVSTVGL